MKNSAFDEVNTNNSAKGAAFQLSGYDAFWRYHVLARGLNVQRIWIFKRIQAKSFATLMFTKDVLLGKPIVVRGLQIFLRGLF